MSRGEDSDPTGNVNLEKPSHVFVQLNDVDCEGVAVTQKNAATFEVRERRGGRSNAGFSYRLVALRRGFEEKRLAHEPSHDDDLALRK